MKSSPSALLLFLLAAPLTTRAAEQLIPAGSLIQCTVSEPKLSSKTADVGDPVLCRVSHVEQYGRSTLPYNSYLVGRFEDYKDPGHFVGKGWMELRFDRMVIQPDTVIPVAAKVVYVKGYNVDRQGRILGKGHPVRDIVEWTIPILWPIDLLNLPRRGPRPVLKEESRLTLKIMDDLGVPMPDQPQIQDGNLARRAPANYAPEPAPMAPRPIVQTYVQPMLIPAPAPYGFIQRRYVPAYPPPPPYAAPGYPAPGYGPPPYSGPGFAPSSYTPSGYPATGYAVSNPTTAGYTQPLEPSDSASPQEPVQIIRDGAVYRTVYP